MSERSEPTDNDHEANEVSLANARQERAAPPPPRRRKSPATKHVPPPPRRARPQTVAGASNGAEGAPRAEPSLGDVLNAVNAMGGDMADVKQRLAQVEAGGMKTIDQVLDPKVIAREADPEELTPFVQNIRQQTKPTPEDFKRKEKNYNYAPRLYCKPDGSIVSLQGDPGNRAFYKDKGFVELDAEQTRRWYKTERPVVVKQQQAKAALINSIRRAVDLDPVLENGLDANWETDLDHMTVAELRAQRDEIAGTPMANGLPRKMFARLPRLQDADDRKAQVENDRLLAGVETSADTSKEAFEAKLDAAQRSGRAREAQNASFR